MEEADDNVVVVNLTDNNDFPQVAQEVAEEDPDSDHLYDDEVLVGENEANLENEAEVGVAENPIDLADDDDNEAEISAENGNENGEEREVEEVNNPFADDEDSDEDGGGVQVTIRKLEPTEKPAARQGKLDLDSTAMINDKPIYDLDLAQMEDRPWRKPGADLTDYFNYGFTEETWNLYCERQKKLRTEFAGNQQQANTALFSAIKISNPLANPVMNTSSSVVKVLTDNGGRFKQPAQHHQPPPSPMQNEQVIRTIISGNSQPTPSLMDFTRPPPGMSVPPPPLGVATPAILAAPPSSVADPIFTDAPPGVDGSSSSDLPPGIESTPIASAPPPSFGGGLDLSLGLPGGFNPNLPPPGMGMWPKPLPPPGFSMPPPQFEHSRAGFGPGPIAGQPPRSLLGSSAFGAGSDDEEERRGSRRKRSRSRSPRRDRDRDERRDRDTRRRGERESDRLSSRRHRSRSNSGERRRRRDEREREKRRERRGDEDDRKKRSRRDDEDDPTRKDKKEKTTRSRTTEDEEPTGTSGTGNEDSSAE